MQYCVIVNGYSGDVYRHLGELTGFVNRAGLKAENGKTIIICNREWDGDDKRKLTEMAPTKSVIFIITEKYEPEMLLSYLAKADHQYDIFLFGSGYYGSELAIRLGSRLNGSSLDSCMGLTEAEGQYNAERLVYAGHMKGSFRLMNRPYCLSLAKGLDEESPRFNMAREVSEYRLAEDGENNFYTDLGLAPIQHKGQLGQAAFVIIVGQGVKTKEAAAKVKEQAAQIKAVFGASRPVVMKAWSPMETLVGVSGTMVKPDLCITVGVSGAPAFYVGVEKSKLLVAINTDANAPIIKKSDVSIIGDYKQVMEELVSLMEGVRWISR